VGTGGTLLASPTGGLWHPVPSGTPNWLVAVACPDGQFVAVGDQGTIITSPDGNVWTVTSAGSARFDGVAYGGGIWLAVGEGGAVARSTDGFSWAAGNAGVTGWLRAIVYQSEQKQFLVAGQDGVMLATTDGIIFKTLNSGTTADIECIASGGTSLQYLAAGSGGYIARSPDGVAWNAIGPSGTTHFRGCTIIGNTAVCVGTSGTIVSSDLSQVNWQTAATATTADLYGVGFGNAGNVQVAVAVGQGGTLLTSPLAAPTGAISASLHAPAPGSSLTLSANAGGGDLSYQWSFNGNPIPGATGATLQLSQIQLNQFGNYSVTVTNLLGSTVENYDVFATYQPRIPGLIDESFNPPISLTQFRNDIPILAPTAAAVQADGKVLVAYPFLNRFNADGSPDMAFNLATLADSDVSGIYAQPDGKILVSTSDPNALLAGGSPSPGSYRLNADGTLDASYTPHLVLSSFGYYGDAIPQIMLQNGDYLASETTSFGSIVRLTPDGVIDPTFTPTSPAGSIYIMDPLGRILVSGKDFEYIFRLNPDGTPDPSFSQVTTEGLVKGLYLQGNGDVVYTEILAASSDASFVQHRLNSDGSPDPTYQGLALPAGAGPQWTVPASAMTSDGSLWLDVMPSSEASGVPFPIINGTFRSGIIRIDPNGHFDPSYTLNVEGSTFLGTSGSERVIGPIPLEGIFPAPNGEWIVWGYFDTFNGEPRPGIVKIHPQVGTQYSALGNLSVRTQAGVGPQSLIVGFVTQGPGDVDLLLRGIGPGLAAFGVPGFLPDPKLSLFDQSSALLSSDDNWGDNANGPAVAAAALNVGAFALTTGSQDAAETTVLGPGGYSFEVYGAGGSTGIALAEAYTVSPSPPHYGAPRAINFSCRSQAGSGANTLIAGFVIEGGNSKRVLIRAVGPTLTSFGVNGVMPDPELTLYSGSLPIAKAGPGWRGDPLLPATFEFTGAFALPAGSLDAAMTLTLSPGPYTAEVTSESGTSGVALIEVYEVP
jgi:uncharacterized delta-60 repeat protein